MKRLFLLLFLPLLLSAAEKDYFALFDFYPEILGPLGENQEIEILLTDEAIQKAETIAEERLLKKGISSELAKEWSRVGIINEDQYLYWVRDAVRFPSGALGTYDRILWKSGLERPAGVGVLPVLPDGRILVNLNYRHATRGWEVELPRGMRHVGESIEAAACRELQEETGATALELIYLGEISPDSGILSQPIPLFLGKVIAKAENAQDFSEAIAANDAYTLEELKDLFLRGSALVKIQGKLTKATVRDAFLAYALFQAEIRGCVKEWK
ncbi:NUDIX hydrolase [Simkania sp.]|uniref:NUDIX hydrolase n=1 Tax=Simkania sp. TaxID=34094 RepID=UPI003B52AF6D